MSVSHLRRTYARRYLLALLSSDEVTQGVDCEKGPLFVNCDGDPIEVLDSESHQLFEDVEATYELKTDDAAVIIYVPRVNYTLTREQVEFAGLSVRITIVVNGRSGLRRQDMADLIEQRILYRLLSYTIIQDATTLEDLTSILRWGTISITSEDVDEFEGTELQRDLQFTLKAEECIKRTNCDDIPVCFDFENLFNEGICDE